MRGPCWYPLLYSLALLLAPGRSSAGNVVIYRCTDAFGALTVQNDVPCPKGSRQQRNVIKSPPPVPAYRPAIAHRPTVIDTAPPAATVPPEKPAAAAPTIADADRLPPPALYQCNTFDNDSYLSESATPEPRCVRLQTTDLQGGDDNSGGVACQMVTDQCQRIADGAACAAWKRRLHETEATWKFARAEDAEADKAGYERVQAIVRDSTCGK